MGWLTGIPLGPNMSVREELDKLIAVERDGMKQRVLKSALVAMREYYAAVELIDADGSRRVFACMFLVHIGTGRERGTYGYKDMDESMGPCYDRCPAKILDLLTEPANETAAAWRAACRDSLASHARIRQLAPGQWIRLNSAVLCKGVERTAFRVVRFPSVGGNLFHDGSNLCRMSPDLLHRVGSTIVDMEPAAAAQLPLH